MAAAVEENPKVFALTERIGKALYVAKIVLRQSYILKKEFVRLHANVHDSVDHPSLVPMDLSVRSIATAENVEEHLKKLHTAMRHCLGLLICYIEKDERDHGKKTDLIGLSRSFVRVQLQQLINDTKDLMDDGPHLETDPHKPEQCTSDEHAQMAAFDFLIFTYRILDELPTWIQLVIRNLIVFREKQEKVEINAITN